MILLMSMGGGWAVRRVQKKVNGYPEVQ